MSVTSVNPLSTPAATSNASVATTDAAESQDRFLKMLVAQLANQDPMNPMDNAQMTSQMAQINTVTGIQQLNESLKAMSTQFSSMQVLQGAAMVGREVLTSGNTMSLTGLAGKGAFDLAGAADSVKVDILSAGGQVVDSLNLGSQNAGRVMFDWSAPESLAQEGLTYRVQASQNGKDVASATLARDRIVSIGTEMGALTLELQGQKLAPMSAVVAFL